MCAFPIRLQIAYINHDIDDAIRGEILSEEDIPRKYREVLGFSTKERLNTMVHDIIAHSMDKPDIRMSEEVEQAMQELRSFMFDSGAFRPLYGLPGGYVRGVPGDGGARRGSQRGCGLRLHIRHDRSVCDL